MFGFGVKGKAKNLLSVIFRFSSILLQQNDVFPNRDGNQDDVECVLTGLSCFLASGFANDNDLAFELVPTYQKQIMPKVNKQEFDRRTQLVQTYYSEFRDKAIEIQEGQTDWLMPLVEEFGHMIARYLHLNDTYDCHSTLSACVLELTNNINPKLHI